MLNNYLQNRCMAQSMLVIFQYDSALMIVNNILITLLSSFVIICHDFHDKTTKVSCKCITNEFFDRM